MNKKHIILFVAALVLLLALVTVLCVQCSNAGPEPGPTEPSGTTTPAQTTQPATKPNETKPAETQPQREPGVYLITILPSAHGTVTAEPVQAKEGEKIVLTVKPEDGYELISLTANGKPCEMSFLMPAEDVTVLAKFALKESTPTEPESETKVYPSGDFFGSAGDHHSSDVLQMGTDSGKKPYLFMDAGKATPLFAYAKGASGNRFYFELIAQVTDIRSDEQYPKFGLMINDGTEMVKFYLDMTTDMKVSTIGAVCQEAGKEDDWAGQTTWSLNKKLDLAKETVKLGLLRDADTYYFYVDDQLVATGSGLSEKDSAVGIFSFGTSLKVTEYELSDSEKDVSSLLKEAKADAEAFKGPALSENYFTNKGDGIYTLITDSKAQHMVDDMTCAGKLVREKFYSLKGKLTLTGADTWGQARILISADAKNEYVIALEKVGKDRYQIFTESKSNESGWSNWQLIDPADLNGNRNSIDFEVIVNGDQLYFLVNDVVYYTANSVSMTESTVKFSGYNTATTTVENLSLKVFANAAEVGSYADSKASRFGENFGVSEGTYWTTNGVDLQKDSSNKPAISFAGKAPQYAYLNGVYTDKFCFETEINVKSVLNNDKYPKFGIVVNGASEMVKFFVDMTAQKTASHVGVVCQPAGGEDNWGASVSCEVPGMAFTGSDTVKLKLVRDGSAYYFYVNGELYLYNEEGFKAEKGAVGIFSFNTEMTASGYKLTTGESANSIISKAKEDVAVLTKVGLTTNFFEETEDGSFTLITDSDAQHLVDDVKIGRDVFKTSFYSVKGKLTLTDAGDWGQARILVSADAKNEYFIALEKTSSGDFQIFTMSKADEDGWNDWRLIDCAAVNGDRNSIDFEVIVDGDRMFFLIDDTVYYISNRVPVAESTVKFTGYNTATTTVEDLSVHVFENAAAAKRYVERKIRNPYESQYQDRMDALYNEYITGQNCAGKGGTLIFGDSNMDFWGAWQAQSGLTKYVNGYNVGIGGSTTRDWLHAYDQLIAPFAADRFVILLGGNDVNVWGTDGETVVENLKALFEKIHADHPDAEIYYIYTTPSPSAYANGEYTNAKLGAMVSGAKALCDSLDYVQGINVFDLMVTADKKNSNEALFAADGIHMNEDGYKVFSDHLYEMIFRGETFGATDTNKTTNGIDISTDKGGQATIEVFGGAPQYAYLHDVFTDKFSFEAKFNVSAVLNNDAWPKFGLQIHGASEMVKFFVDMKPDMTATHVGVVYQPTGGGDDWGGSVSCPVPSMSFAGNDTIELKLVRDGSAYYFYVNGELYLYDMNGFETENGAVGIFSFNTALTASDYSVAVDDDADSAIQTAQADMQALQKLGLSTNHFAETGDGIFTLTTNSDAQHLVDDLKIGRDVIKTAFYSVKGKLTLTNANMWGQARILISSDGQNEHFIALERANTGNFQIITMSKANEAEWNYWYAIERTILNGNRNSIDFEVIVNGNQLYFLVDDTVVYTSNRVSMTESTVKFSGCNTATTTVENLSLEIFDSAAAVQTYADSKNSRIGENFGVCDGAYATTDGVDLKNDKGTNPTVQITGGVPQYAYLHDVFTDKFCFETEINVQAVLNGDAWPKFGLMVKGETERVNFFVDMTPEMTAGKVGVVREPTGGDYNWGGSVSKDIAGMSFTGNDTVRLKLVRSGRAYYFYVNGQLVMYDLNGFQAENGAVGIFSFNTKLTASKYSILVGNDANEQIAAAVKEINFFDNADVDLSKDYGANVGTVSANTGKTEFIFVKDFNHSDFYFETKIHVNEVYKDEKWPKFGIFAESGNTRENFYVDMTSSKTASTVGRMTSTNNGRWSDNWGAITTKTVDGMKFSGDGEYVTLGLKKEGNRFFLYVNGEFALYHDSAITGNTTVGVFGFNTGMELKEYFVDKKEGIDSLLTLQTEGSIGTVALDGKIWTDKTYKFYEMPSEFIGESYIQNAMKSEINFEVKKDGYIYVLTPHRDHTNTVADKLEQDLYDRIETPAWYLASYSTKVNYWAYERRVKAGETVTIKDSSAWHMVVVSELPIDPTLHQIGDTVFADNELAVLAPTEGSVLTVDHGGLIFSNRAESAAKFGGKLPYYCLGKDFVYKDYNSGSKAVKATVTKAGKVLVVGSNNDARKDHFVNTLGFTYVADLSSYGDIIAGGSYSDKGYGLYIKEVSKDEVINWTEEYKYNSTNYTLWMIPMFQSGTKLPAEPPVSIEITQMPTKTTYKLGEDFDPAGMVVKATDKYGNVTVLDSSQYVTVPSKFTADASAAAVIVNDLVAAIPVTITDANGNDLADNSAYSTDYYTTQKAPLLNGSVKRSTVEQVIAAIQKMEADGATAFNVHLTELAEEYRNYDAFKRIADCTNYPVMAIAYGDESTRAYRIDLMKEAVRAGFDIVDIRLDTFDADSKASLTGTVFETANPNEVSMNPDVIAQQKMLVQEFKDLGAEVLLSAHVGVSLTEEEGLALAKEMEDRGADVAKIVLGSSANSMQDVVMQTNQRLKSELGIKFYYNASGTASKPYRTASTLFGTYMVFCYAEYHETNLATYDYIMDLKAFYQTVPGLVAPQPMLKTNNDQKIDIVKLGKKIWTTRDDVFTSLPEAFIGKEFVKATFDVSGQTVDVTVQRSGYIYVLTNAYKISNSQAEILDEMNYTKLDMASWKFCDSTENISYIWVYEKYVEAGETLQLGQWSVVIASDTRLDLESDSNKTPDSDMAVLKPLDTGASVGNMELGVKAFADKGYTFSDMPYWLAGKNYILGNYGAGSAKAVRGGVVYMLTNTGNSGNRVSYFENAGYERVDVPAFVAFTGGNFGYYDFVVFKKTVAENETVTWPSWAVPVFSGNLMLSDNLAKIEADGITTQAAQYDQNVRLFDNRTYYASGDTLNALHGKSYLYAGFEEGATGTVRVAGTVYVQIPVKTGNTRYEQLEEELIAAGYTPVPYRLYRNNKGLPGKSLGYAQKLYQKEVAVGETIHFGQYNLVYFDTLNDDEYYEMPSVTTGANIYNNPAVSGIQNPIYTYNISDRNWQGCPVVTITDGPNGGKRMWAAWFTGGETELATGNFAVLLYSDDEGQTWVDPAVAIVHPDVAAQVTKPQLWTLADGRLWVSWSQHTGTGGFDGKMGTWAAICENPGDPVDELRWSEPVRLFDGRGNGKVTVLNKGQANEEWLTTAFDWIDRNYSKVYSSTDKGATWTFKGKAEVTGSTYNNAILTERKDGNGNTYLWMLLRQLEGNMKESFSYDGGVTWTNATTSHIAHPNSAIYVGWTSSGKLLMINHKDFTGRNNLTAFLSEDGGKTWPYTLLLDARTGVSYPDVIEDNGTFYVVYDYDRFNTGRMYMAKITEADIMAGQLVTADSYLKHQFSDMGINGAQVGSDAQEIDLSDKIVSASTTGSPARDAFDKNTDTRWCATSDAMPQWLMIDLKEVYNLEAVYMFFEQKSDWNYKVEISVDGNEWRVYSDPDAQRIIDVTINRQAQARYVRLTVESTTDGAWASVWEMEIYANKNEPVATP